MTTSTRSNWMLYGAYGTTGRRILEEALRRGHRPVLAGRDRAKLAALGKETGLRTVYVALEDGTALRAALAAVNCVVLAAGPFEVTGPAMRAACIDAGCSYLDINAEIDDFSAAMACDAAARAAGIGIIPGVGYGVVFAESLAAQIAQRLPDATWLRLSLATKNEGSSRGARLSTANVINAGGREVHRGAMRKRALAFSTWQGPTADTANMRFAAAPLGALRAAQASTGIPNIIAGIPLPRIAAAFLRVGGPLLGKLLSWQAKRASRASTASRPKATTPTGSAPAAKESTRAGTTGSPLRSRVWAEAGNAAGERVTAMLETGEGYRAAAAAAVRALELQLNEPRVGALTPAQAFGPRFALLVPGTRVVGLEPSSTPSDSLLTAPR